MLKQYEKEVIYRLGRIHPKGALGPGTIQYWNDIDKCYTINLQDQSTEVKGLDFLTLDMVSIYVDAVIFYKICDPIQAINNVIDYKNSMILLCSSLLRDTVGAYTYEDLRDQTSLRDLIRRNLVIRDSNFLFVFF